MKFEEEAVMRSARKCLLLFFVCALAAMMLPGCAGHEVRHLASDACLVEPGQMDRQQVLGLLGPPDQKVSLDNGAEQWRYYQSQKSLLRRTPYIGDKLGEESFDVLTITFQAEGVTECVYRHLNQSEFDKLGIDTHEAVE